MRITKLTLSLLLLMSSLILIYLAMSVEADRVAMAILLCMAGGLGLSALIGLIEYRDEKVYKGEK